MSLTTAPADTADSTPQDIPTEPSEGAEPELYSGPVPDFDIPAWNGHRAAVSWTFDGGDPSHLDTVLPMLDAAAIPATFYPTCDAIADELGRWALVVLADTHEVANFTTNAAAADGGSDPTPIEECERQLEVDLGAGAHSFAYPDAVVDEPYVSYAEEHYVAARSGWQWIPVVRSSGTSLWYDIPSVVVGDVEPDVAADELLAWPFEALGRANEEAAWLTFTFHSVGSGRGYAAISAEQLQALIDASTAYDVWNAPFGDVATSLRGRLAIEAAVPEADTDSWTWSWQPVAGMTDMAVAVGVDSGELLQDGRLLSLDSEGRFLVDPRVGRLRWRP